MIDKAIACGIGVCLGVALMTAINPVVVPQQEALPIIGTVYSCGTGVGGEVAATSPTGWRVASNAQMCVVGTPREGIPPSAISSSIYGGTIGTTSRDIPAGTP